MAPRNTRTAARAKAAGESKIPTVAASSGPGKPAASSSIPSKLSLPSTRARKKQDLSTEGIATAISQGLSSPINLKFGRSKPEAQATNPSDSGSGTSQPSKQIKSLLTTALTKAAKNSPHKTVTLGSKRSTPSKSKGTTPSKTAAKGAVGKIPSVFVSKDSPSQEKKAPAPTPPKIKTPPPVIDIDFSDDEEELPAVPLKISQPVKSKITSTAVQAKSSELPVKSKPLKSSSQLNATQIQNFPKSTQSKLPPEIKKPKKEVTQTGNSSPEDKRQVKTDLKSVVKSPDKRDTEIGTLKSELEKTKSSLKEKEATILQLQSQPKTPVNKDKEIASLKRELEKVKSALNEKEATIKQLDIKIPNMITEFQKCIENKDSMNNINEQKIRGQIRDHR